MDFTDFVANREMKSVAEIPKEEAIVETTGALKH